MNDEIMRRVPAKRAVRRDFSAASFTAWMKRRGLNTDDAAAMIGISRNAAYDYKRNGAPYYIGLACAAIEADLDVPSEDNSK